MDALAFDGIDNHHAKHQCAQRIHGLVALQKALGQGLVDIVARGGAEQAGRQEKGGPAHNGQGQNQHRGDDFADVVHQLARVEREQKHQRKINAGKDEQIDWGVAHKGGDPHGKRHRGGARGGKQGANAKVHRHAQGNAGGLAQGGSQCRHAPAHAGQGHHREQRQAHTGEQKAQGSRPQLISGRQPDHGRKNDVASPQKEGKSHKAKGQNVPEMEFFRRHDGRDCDKNKLHVLVSWRFKK